jgi:hypothetical protein
MAMPAVVRVSVNYWRRRFQAQEGMEHTIVLTEYLCSELRSSREPAAWRCT